LKRTKTRSKPRRSTRRKQLIISVPRGTKVKRKRTSRNPIIIKYGKKKIHIPIGKKTRVVQLKRKKPSKRKMKKTKTTPRQRYLSGKLIHEGYYIDEADARKVAKKHGGYVKYHRHGLYEGSYEVFAPVPSGTRLKQMFRRK